jgi:type VI secretion system secreted protein Hcp
MPVYLKYGGIKGPVREPAHRGWIELESAQFGSPHLTQYGTGSARNVSRNPSEIVVTKLTDSASSSLFRESLAGQGVKATIEFANDEEVYLRVEMTGTLITSYSMSGRGDRPMESLTLNCERVEFKPIPGIPAE